jgi:hypothetical protein
MEITREQRDIIKAELVEGLWWAENYKHYDGCTAPYEIEKITQAARLEYSTNAIFHAKVDMIAGMIENGLAGRHDPFRLNYSERVQPALDPRVRRD